MNPEYLVIRCRGHQLSKPVKKWAFRHPHVHLEEKQSVWFEDAWPLDLCVQGWMTAYTTGWRTGKAQNCLQKVDTY